MKVCHFTTGHSPFDSRIFQKQCRSLARFGFETHLAVPGIESQQVAGVYIHSDKPRRAHRWSRLTRSGWDIYKVAKKIDATIYHFHDPSLLPFGLLLVASGKKVIYDVHEDFPRQTYSKEYIPRFMRASIAGIVETFEDLVAPFMTAIVAATPSIAHRFLKKNRQVEVIHNYPIREEFSIGPSEPRVHRRVCYAGLIAEVRGAKDMIRSVHEAGCQLALAGPFSDEKLFSRLQKELGWQSVLHLGILNRQGIRDLYCSSCAGLVLFHPEPNHVDSMPNKIFEYMAAGLPVIASNFALWKEIIEQGQCGICVDPTDHREVVHSIRWILNHPEQAQQMGLNGKKLVEQKYNWGAEEQKLIKLYLSLSGRKADEFENRAIDVVQ